MEVTAQITFYSRAEKLGFLAIYGRIWPAYARRDERQAIGAALLLILAAIMLPCLFVFHLSLLFFAFPPLLLIFPVAFIWGLTLLGRRRRDLARILPLLPGKSPVALRLADDGIELRQGEKHETRAYTALKATVCNADGCYLFWGDGKGLFVPAADFIQGNPKAFADFLCEKRKTTITSRSEVI